MRTSEWYNDLPWGSSETSFTTCRDMHTAWRRIVWRIKPCCWSQKAEHTDSIYEFRCFFLKCPCPQLIRNDKNSFVYVSPPFKEKKIALLNLFHFSVLYYRLNHMKLLMFWSKKWFTLYSVFFFFFNLTLIHWSFSKASSKFFIS